MLSGAALTRWLKTLEETATARQVHLRHHRIRKVPITDPVALQRFDRAGWNPTSCWAT